MAVVTSLTFILGSASLAQAAPNHDAKVKADFAFADAQFTDCPATPPTEGTLDCLGSDVFIESSHKTIGHEHFDDTTLQLTVVNVRVFPDHFEIGDVVATGIAHPNFDPRGLRRARIQATVPMSDSTDATVDVTLKGVGPTFSIKFSDVFPEPLCPEGFVAIRLHQRVRDATATGTVTFHDVAQQPTSVAQVPFIVSEHDKGHCTDAPPPPPV